MCFQISLTAPTQIAPQTSLIKPEALHILNCKNLRHDRCESQATHQATQSNDSKQAKQICNKKTNGDKTPPSSCTNSTKDFQPLFHVFSN